MNAQRPRRLSKRAVLVSLLVLASCSNELSVGLSPSYGLATERDAGHSIDAGRAPGEAGERAPDAGGGQLPPAVPDARAPLGAADSPTDDTAEPPGRAVARDAGGVDAGPCANAPDRCEPDAGEPLAPPGACPHDECPLIVFLAGSCGAGVAMECWRDEPGGPCAWSCSPNVFFAPADAGHNGGVRPGDAGSRALSEAN